MTRLYIAGDPRYVRGFVERDLGVPWFRAGMEYVTISENADILYTLPRFTTLVIEGPGRVRPEAERMLNHLAAIGRVEFIGMDDIRTLQLIEEASKTRLTPWELPCFHLLDPPL